MSEQKKSVNIILIWVGILIPIVAALIPYALSYVQPESKLSFRLIGPVRVKENHAFSVNISNDGKRLEKNVKVWLKAAPIPIFREERPRKPEELLSIESKAQYSVKKEAGYFVISLGDLRPDEAIEVAVLSEAINLIAFGRSAYGIEVKSDEHLAILESPSDLESILYTIGFWGFIVLMVMMLVIGIYQEHIKKAVSNNNATRNKSDKRKKTVA